MKKYFYITIFTSLIISGLSFTLISMPPHKKKTTKEKITIVEKPNCDCSTPTNFKATPSGSETIFEWVAVTGAKYYSFGGYYSGGSGFSYCPTTNSISIPTNSGGTAQVRAICEGTCSGATCSSGTAGPITF